MSRNEPALLDTMILIGLAGKPSAPAAAGRAARGAATRARKSRLCQAAMPLLPVAPSYPAATLFVTPAQAGPRATRVTPPPRCPLRCSREARHRRGHDE